MNTDTNRHMKRAHIEHFIQQLDGMIATFGQAVVLSGRSPQEDAASELLKDARLKLIEDIERMPPDPTQQPAAAADVEEMVCQPEDLIEATVWHVDTKSTEHLEYYLLIKDGNIQKQTPVILNVQHEPYLSVSSNVYEAADYDYTVHDFCDHEHGECEAETDAYAHHTYLDGVARRLNILDDQMNIVRRLDHIQQGKTD